MKKVSVILADGFEEVEALTVVDLLRRATIYVDTVSIMDDYTVHGSHGINVQTEDLFEEVNFVGSDMIVLPGGMPGTKNLDAHAGVRRVVKGFFDEGKKIAAICAAPTVLGNMGLLKGKRISCYPSMEKEIQGAVISGAGPDATLDQMLEGLRQLLEKVAEGVPPDRAVELLTETEAAPETR